MRGVNEDTVGKLYYLCKELLQDKSLHTGPYDKDLAEAVTAAEKEADDYDAWVDQGEKDDAARTEYEDGVCKDCLAGVPMEHHRHDSLLEDDAARAEVEA